MPRPGAWTGVASLPTLVLALSYRRRSKRADRLIKHPWELEARSGLGWMGLCLSPVFPFSLSAASLTSHEGMSFLDPAVVTAF